MRELWYKLLGGVGIFLMGMGVVVFLFAGYQLWGTNLDEQAKQKDLTTEAAANLGLAPATETASQDVNAQVIEQLSKIDPKTVPTTPAPVEGTFAGMIEIPKIGVQKAFVEGVTKPDLRKGPGHYIGTPYPGQAGNVGIAGHRTTYGAPFNRIDELVPGDQIWLYTNQGKFLYEVLPPPAYKGIERGPGWFTVDPSDTTVLDQTGENLVTLTACHPKRSAAQRIIVHAKLTAEPLAATPPPSTTVPTAPADDQSAVEQPTDESALFAGDPAELKPSVIWGSGFLGLWAIATTFGAWMRRTQRRYWYWYILALAPAGFLLWNCFVHLDKWLPSF